MDSRAALRAAPRPRERVRPKRCAFSPRPMGSYFGKGLSKSWGFLVFAPGGLACSDSATIVCVPGLGEAVGQL